MQLTLNGSTETVRVYDGAHGHNEMHRYTRSEGKQPGEPFHAGTLGEGMRAAIEEIERGYAEMIEGWKEAMSTENGRSPAAKVMDEAIDLAIEGRSPYPERAAFIDSDTVSAGLEIKRAADEGLPVVLVAEDGTTRVLMPEATTR